MGASLVFDILGRDVSGSKALKNFAKEAEHTSGSFTNAFKKAASGLVLAGVAGLAESVRMAGDFQSQMTRLVTAAGESEGNLKMVSAGVLKVARDTGTGTTELASGMYMIESAGFHGANGLKVLTAAAQGAKIEGADLGSTGNALTTVLNDLHAPAAKAADIMSQMVTTVGQGKMTMDDLAGSIHSVLPNAVALGISFPQVAGALAEMTSQGISADQAAQNLNHAIVKLAAPTIQMTQYMALYGIDAKDLAKNLGKNGLTGTLGILSEAILKHMGPAGLTLHTAFMNSKQASQDAHRMYLLMTPAIRKMADEFLSGKWSALDFAKEMNHVGGEAGVLGHQWIVSQARAAGFAQALKSGGQDAQTFTGALKSMMGDQVGLQVAMHLTGESMGGFVDKVHAIGAASADSNGQVRDWAIKQKTLNVQIAKLTEVVKTAMIEIGTKLVPAVTASVAWVTKHKDVIEKLGIALLAVAVTVKVLSVAIGTARKVHEAWTVATKIAIGVQSGYKMALGYSTVATQAQSAATAKGTIGYVAQKVALVATTVASKAAAAAQWLLNAAMDANPVMLIVTAIVALVAGFVLAYKKIGWFRDFVKAAFKLIESVITTVFTWVTKHWPLLLAILTGPIGLAVKFIVDHWHAITQGVADIINWVKAHWPLLLAIFTGPIGLVVKFIVDHFNAIVSFVAGLPGAIGRVAVGMWDGIKNAFKAAINWIIEAWDSLSFTIHVPHIWGTNIGGDVRIGVPQIPLLAKGATINPRPGGTLAILGEAGRRESVVDTGVMNHALDKMNARLDRQSHPFIGGGHVRITTQVVLDKKVIATAVSDGNLVLNRRR